MAKVSEIQGIKQARDVYLAKAGMLDRPEAVSATEELSDEELAAITSDNYERFNRAADQILGWTVRRVDNQTIQSSELVVDSEGEVQPNISLGFIAMRTDDGEIFGLGTEWYFKGDQLLDEDLGPVKAVYTVPGIGKVAGDQRLAAERLSELENSIEAYAQAQADQPAVS
jgi:hypothetical protein